jgi:hypothetical protein
MQRSGLQNVGDGGEDGADLLDNGRMRWRQDLGTERGNEAEHGRAAAEILGEEREALRDRLVLGLVHDHAHGRSGLPLRNDGRPAWCLRTKRTTWSGAPSGRARTAGPVPRRSSSWFLGVRFVWKNDDVVSGLKVLKILRRQEKESAGTTTEFVPMYLSTTAHFRSGIARSATRKDR